MDDDGRNDPPPTVEALADLQAGLLDDDAAARLRKLVRTDADVRQTMDALNRVRHEVAALGSDPSSAPDVDPAAVLQGDTGIGYAALAVEVQREAPEWRFGPC